MQSIKLGSSALALFLYISIGAEPLKAGKITTGRAEPAFTTMQDIESKSSKKNRRHCKTKKCNNIITNCSLPLTIRRPGKWLVTENLCYRGKCSAITVLDTKDVIIDFCGHSLDLRNSAKNGVKVLNSNRVTIENGAIINSAFPSVSEVFVAQAEDPLVTLEIFATSSTVSELINGFVNQLTQPSSFGLRPNSSVAPIPLAIIPSEYVGLYLENVSASTIDRMNFENCFLGLLGYGTQNNTIVVSNSQALNCGKLFEELVPPSSLQDFNTPLRGGGMLFYNAFDPSFQPIDPTLPAILSGPKPSEITFEKCEAVGNAQYIGIGLYRVQDSQILNCQGTSAIAITKTSVNDPIGNTFGNFGQYEWQPSVFYLFACYRSDIKNCKATGSMNGFSLDISFSCNATFCKSYSATDQGIGVDLTYYANVINCIAADAALWPLPVDADPARFYNKAQGIGGLNSFGTTIKECIAYNNQGYLDPLLSTPFAGGLLFAGESIKIENCQAHDNIRGILIAASINSVVMDNKAYNNSAFGIVNITNFLAPLIAAAALLQPTQFFRNFSMGNGNIQGLIDPNYPLNGEPIIIYGSSLGVPFVVSAGLAGTFPTPSVAPYDNIQP